MEADFPYTGEVPRAKVAPQFPVPLDRVLEKQWMQSAKEGCQLAFNKLVETHQDRIFSLCLRLLGSYEDAAEACQDVFVRAYRALPDFRLEARFSTWLYRIAVNRSYDFRKRKSSKLKVFSFHLTDREKVLTSPECPPDHQIGWQESLRELDHALQKLPPKDREILILSGVENFSHLECAEILGTSLRGVEGRLYRAREKLRKIWPRPIPLS